MTDKLLCPFCGEKLVRYWGMEKPALYCCDNPKCSKGGIGTEQSWQALTDTKKKLDIAVDGLETISLKEHKTTPSVFLIKYAQKTLEQINQKEEQ